MKNTTGFASLASSTVPRLVPDQARRALSIPLITFSIRTHHSPTLTHTSLISTLQAFGEKCIIYGLDQEEKIGNLELKGFSEQGFVDDLARAKGVIANGGLSLMNEAVSLQRPFFSVPVENQYEQVLNAWYLEKLGYGVFADKIELEALREWAHNIPQYAKALSNYHHDSNMQLYKTVKRVLEEFNGRFIWWDLLKSFK